MEMDHVHGQEELNSMTPSTTKSSVDVVYNDDEAPAEPPPDHARRSGVLLLNMHCEYPAVPNGAEHKDFAVMVHLKAPPLQLASAAAPVDLVAVLDVSESMAGSKLTHVKRAMAFVIDRLGPRDRLSVVAFSGGGGAARRLIRLTCMTDDGKAAAKRAVEALEAASGGGGGDGGSANLRAGLDEAAKVLDGSRRVHRNDVASVILVSGGRHGGDDCSGDVVLLPPFYRAPLGSRLTPVHTFLLGSGDDTAAAAAAAMHEISEVTGGTFSFVEDHAVIQDALARCVGGLLSVTIKGAFVKIKCAMFPLTMDMLRVTAIKSGSYENSVKFESPRYRPRDEGWVILGHLYAGEERRILCFLDVPAEDADEDPIDSTRLLNVRCSYVDVASGQTVRVEPADFADEYIKILRPLDDLEAAAGMAARRRSVEVERELVRVAAAEDMARARDAAERGDYAEATRILDARREAVRSSSPAMSGDAVCAAVADELHELSRRVADESEYGKTGRACILASMSSHSLQRGLRFGSGIVGSSPSMFATPAMRKMEKLSETMRKKQQEVSRLRTTLPENGSKADIPLVDSHRRLEARLASGVPRLSMLSKYRRLVLRR